MKKIIFTVLVVVSNFALANDVTKDICDYLDYNDYVYRDYPYQNSKSEKEIKEMRELHSDLKKNMVCGKLRKKVKFDYYSDVYLNNPVATIYFNAKATEDEKKAMDILLEIRERIIKLKKTVVFLGDIVTGKLNNIAWRLNDIDVNNEQNLPILNETCGDLIFGDKVYRDTQLVTSIGKLRRTILAFGSVARKSFIPSKKMMIKNMDFTLSGSINLGPWSDPGDVPHADFAGLDRIINCFQNKVIFGQRLPESKKIF